MTTMMNYEVQDGVAVITLDDPDRPMNVVTPEWLDEMNTLIDQVAKDDAVQGAVITSGKAAFMAGADLKGILELMENNMSVDEALAFSRDATGMHRKLETCGKPFVAAINGLALGGGYELCLACHHRIVADNPKIKLGLPEVSVGLLAGSGGTQRLPRMIGLQNAVPIIVDGKAFGPEAALKAGLVDAVVAVDQLLDAAKKAIKNGLDPVREWDQSGYQLEAGQGLLKVEEGFSYAELAEKIAAKTRGNYPAPIANLDAIFEGTVLPFDQALEVETKLFAGLMTSPEARNIIRTSFVNKGAADKLIRRPQGIPKASFTKVGVLGAGLMGAGIAHITAKAGIDVVLLDSKIEFAEKGKNYSEKIVNKAIDRGRMNQAKADTLLAKITPTVDYSDLAGCDLIIEAVFEDIEVKADVTRKTEAVISETTIYASNTSTLPISDLAKASKRPDRFIGLHFFSPVERMPLIEVINGTQTSKETLAQALDFVGQVRMTPVLVNDSRGFYTSRVFQTFIHEGMKLLEEGVDPDIIETAGKKAGMPIGPLELTDALTIELPWKIVKQSIAAEGDAYTLPCAYDVMKTMVEDEKRIGRRGDGGFYDYPAEGGKKIWDGLKTLYPVTDDQPDVKELVKRYLHIQALETARCMEEGVLTHPADGDLGSLLGWGFPSYTGGTLSYIDSVGIKTFVAECETYVQQFGPRFQPSAWLKKRADNNTTFYGPNAG